MELGRQTEREVQEKLGQEVEQDRFTRLDRTLLKEVNDEGLIDLRPGAEQSYLGRANRYLLIDRLKKLEHMDLAQEVETGRWSLSPDLKEQLLALGERQLNDAEFNRSDQAHAAWSALMRRSNRICRGPQRRAPG